MESRNVGIKRNPDSLPGILSISEKRTKNENGDRVSSSSPVVAQTNKGGKIDDPVAWFFRNADMVTKLLVPRLDMLSLTRLSLCNRRLQELLGKHYDVGFVRKMVGHAVHFMHGKMFFRTGSYYGEDTECNTAAAIFLKTRSPHYLRQLSAFYGAGGRDVSRLLRFFFPPDGPQHAHVRELIDVGEPFLVVAAMRLFPRAMRRFYYEEFMWHVTLTSYVHAAERFLPMVTALERLAAEDGKMAFHWKSPRLARNLFSVRNAMRDRALGDRMDNADMHNAAMTWLDERLGHYNEHPDAEVHAQARVVVPFLGAPHDHLFTPDLGGYYLHDH